MHSKSAPSAAPVNVAERTSHRGSTLIGWLAVLAYLALSWYVARSDLNLQSLVLVAAIFGILALSLDLVAGMLGLYSLGQGGFFALGAYITTLAATNLEMNVFLLLPIVLVVTGLLGIFIGAASLRVSGLYFAITTFIFTLVITVLATNLQITNGIQGLLGPEFPTLPDGFESLGEPLAWCVMLGLLVAILLMWNLRRSPLYPVLLAIRDAEPFAEAAGIRAAPIKIGVFGLSAAMAGFAGWLFCFLGVVSPSQFDWSVSLNILVMVLLGGINSTIGPLIGAAFVSAFPVLVNINPWLQEIIYGTLSIVAISAFPEGVVGLFRRGMTAFSARKTTGQPGAEAGEAAAISTIETERLDRLFAPSDKSRDPGTVGGEIAVECRGINFGYSTGLKVLHGIDLSVRRGDIHGLIGPNGSGKSTLANIIAGRYRPMTGEVLIKGQRVDQTGPVGRARLGMRRTFQAAELVRELTTRQNVMVGAYSLVSGITRRAAFWPMLRSGNRDMGRMRARSGDALRSVGAGSWVNRLVSDVPHGIEQLTQLASVCVADPDIIILDEPATGLSTREVEHLAHILGALKKQGVTMIIIEHQTRFLFPLCDQVTVLNAGEVILTGTADQVRADPVVRKVYLGE